MSVIRTYDVVDMVIDEAGKKFGNDWTVTEEGRESIRNVSSMIDELVECVGAESITASVDEETMRLHIEVGCFDLDTSDIRPTTNHVFFKIIQSVSLFRFSGSKSGENLTIDFQFNNIWAEK